MRIRNNKFGYKILFGWIFFFKWEKTKIIMKKDYSHDYLHSSVPELFYWLRRESTLFCHMKNWVPIQNSQNPFLARNAKKWVFRPSLKSELWLCWASRVSPSHSTVVSLEGLEINRFRDSAVFEEISRHDSGRGPRNTLCSKVQDCQ